MINKIPRASTRKISAAPTNGRRNQRERTVMEMNEDVNLPENRDRAFYVYCRDIGKVRLLTYEGELEIARRIDRAFTSLGRAVFSAPEGLGLLLDYADALAEDALPEIKLDRKEGEVDEGEQKKIRASFLGLIAQVRSMEDSDRKMDCVEQLGLDNSFIWGLSEKTLAQIDPYDSPAGRIKAEQRAVNREIGELITPNLRLVVSLVAKNRRADVELLDLVQEGNLGLRHAAMKFNDRLGYRFTTYAGWWIKQAMWRGGDDLALTIRLPVHVNTSLRAMRQGLDRLLLEGIEPTSGNIAEKIGLPVDKVDKLLEIRLLNHTAGIDAPIDNEDGSSHSLQDLIADDSAVDPELSSDLSVPLKKLETAIEALNKRERFILLGRAKGKTLQEVGDQLGISRERVRQLESLAKGKIRLRLGRDSI